MREIRKYQKSTDMLLRRLPFSRVVRVFSYFLAFFALFDSFLMFRYAKSHWI